MKKYGLYDPSDSLIAIIHADRTESNPPIPDPHVATMVTFHKDGQICHDVSVFLEEGYRVAEME